MAVTRRRVTLGLVTAVAGAGVGYSALRDEDMPAGVSSMSPPEALAAVEAGKVVLIDIRRPDEWTATGVPIGAVPIDMRRDDFVEAVRAELAAQGKPVALICARGVRSRRMSRVLHEAGIAPIVDVPEGMLGSASGPGWLKRGLPVVAWTG